MLMCNPYEIVIQGITGKGKTFRPSDWSERLCGILSSFDSNRLSYHDWVRPILVDNVRCVAVDKKLEQINPAMFHFLMDFAHDNDLRVIDCKKLMEEQAADSGDSRLDNLFNAQAKAEAEQRAAAQAAEQSEREALAKRPAVGELPPSEWHRAYSLLHRNGLIHDSEPEFARRAAETAEGQRLAVLTVENQPVALCFFHIRTCLIGGRQLHIDALCGEEHADTAHWTLLFDFLQQTAAAQSCRRLTAAAPTGEAGSLLAYLLIGQGFIIDTLALRKKTS